MDRRDDRDELMIDLIHLFVLVAFFVISGIYAKGCESL